jgi:hypothetical protein
VAMASAESSFTQLYATGGTAAGKKCDEAGRTTSVRTSRHRRWYCACQMVDKGWMGRWEEGASPARTCGAARAAVSV